MLIWSYWPDPEGGAERQCRLLVESLSCTGNVCTVLAGCSRHAQSTDAVKRFGLFCPLENAMRRILFVFAARCGGCRKQSVAQAMAFWLLVPFMWLARLSFIIDIALLVRRHNRAPFDLIHVHDSGWLAGLGVWLGAKWNIPVLCKEATAPALQEIGYGTPFRRYWGRLRLEATGWTAQTLAIKSQLSDLCVPKVGIHLIPNGARLPDRVSDVREHNGALYVGNLTQGAQWKAFDVLFEGWAEVAKAYPSASLCFVGGGDPAPWRHKLAKSGVLDTVNFVGRVADPASYYVSAAIFILPSRVEGMSNALLEAQSYGLACVVSDIPGNTAVVEHGVNGLVVPVNDKHSLAQAIIRLLSDGVLREKLGSAAREKIRREFNLETVTVRILAIYKSLAEQSTS
jgi:glycosyltransferase involved in cell wall biosynthesis